MVDLEMLEVESLRANLQVLAAADPMPGEDGRRHIATLQSTKKAIASKLNSLANKAAAGGKYEKAAAMQSQVRVRKRYSG